MTFISIFGSWNSGYSAISEYESWILDIGASITTTTEIGFDFGNINYVSLLVEGTIDTASYAIAGDQAWYANIRIADTGRLEADADAINFSAPNVVISNMGSIISTGGDGVNVSRVTGL